ncbi:2346_t:CDS:2 [Ambispora gerdemannii]|uniref:DNA 3'-5' helicase n=1 Tax=Ambispora gerdemannii TaxID=144530 RepID=A0A9N9D370_9GLOM|nr:2346_t:CDS:2 [Ambispora gerdemannii]
MEMIAARILCAGLYASDDQPLNFQEQVFTEISSGIICILFITPEKFERNAQFRTLLKNMATFQGIHFIIDEVHCVKNYAYFRESWCYLSQLKTICPTALILMMTATLTYNNARDIMTNLGLDFSCVKIIHGATLKRDELIYEIIKKKEYREENLKETITQIKSIPECSIIYCATQKDCYEVADFLRINLRDENIKVMVATNAFGLGINMPDVCLVIHYTMPLNLSNYIQETGRAGRDGLSAKCILLYARKDVRVLYNIVAGERESLTDITTKGEEMRQVYLMECQKKIWEIIFFCETKYECRQNALTQYHNWKTPLLEIQSSTIESSCGKCDVCQLRAKEKLIVKDMKMPALKLLNVVEVITGLGSNIIIAKDVVDIFCKSKSALPKYKELEIYRKEQDAEVKLTNDEAKRLFNDLVIRGMILTDIILQRGKTAGVFSWTFPVLGVSDGT